MTSTDGRWPPQLRGPGPRQLRAVTAALTAVCLGTAVWALVAGSESPAVLLLIALSASIVLVAAAYLAERRHRRHLQHLSDFPGPAPADGALAALGARAPRPALPDLRRRLRRGGGAARDAREGGRRDHGLRRPHHGDLGRAGPRAALRRLRGDRPHEPEPGAPRRLRPRGERPPAPPARAPGRGHGGAVGGGEDPRLRPGGAAAGCVTRLRRRRPPPARGSRPPARCDRREAAARRADQPPGLPRLPDRARQPGPLRGPGDPRPRSAGGGRPAPCRDPLHRPRRLQGGQRQPGAPLWRSPAPGRDRAAAPGGAVLRHGGPSGGRRVRRPRRGPRRSGGGGRRRRAVPRGAGGHLRPPGQRRDHRGERRHRHRRERVDDLRRPAPRGGRRHVPGQGAGQGDRGDVRRQHAERAREFASSSRPTWSTRSTPASCMSSTSPSWPSAAAR